MELFVKDRLFIPNMLKKENSFMAYNLKKSILTKIGISEEERKNLNMVIDEKNGSVTWDIKYDKANPITVTFSEEELKYLKESCESISEAPYPDDFWESVEKIYNLEN